MKTDPDLLPNLSRHGFGNWICTQPDPDSLPDLDLLPDPDLQIDPDFIQDLDLESELVPEQALTSQSFFLSLVP
jgi:hypothetical protein